MLFTNQQVRKKLFESLFNSFCNKQTIITIAILFLILISSYSLVINRFTYQQNLTEEKNLFLEKVDLNEEWTQIVLEYSTLASTSNVEKAAMQHNMHIPTKSEIKFIK